MLSNTFKSEFQNRINTEGQIYRGVGGAVQTIAGAILGSGSVGKFSMTAFTQERISAISDSMIKDQAYAGDAPTKTDMAFDKVAGELSGEQDLNTLTTVWEKLQSQAERQRVEDMTKRVEQAYKNLED